MASEEPRGISPDVPQGSARLAEILGASVNSNRSGEYLVLRKWFSESIGGEVPDGAFDSGALRLLAPDAPDDIADPRQWLFLDTETTGLAGGTGTYPFMVGIAWWEAGGLEVEQFFMREQSEEHSVLVALADRMAERRVLVTFNGKSFDWPLLETRYRMTRTIRDTQIAGAPRFPAPGALFMAAANRIGAIAGSREVRPGLESGRGCDVRVNTSNLFRFLARRFARSARPDFLP